jgi:phosphatidylglycerol---prolipoprotein diacylglyceryl transferase
MFPDLFSVEGTALTLHTYGLMLMLAFGAAIGIAHLRARVVGVDPDHLLPIAILAIAGGIFGSRLLHLAMAEPELFFAKPWVLFDLTQGGMAVIGGVVSSIVMCSAYAWYKKLPVLKLADASAPCILIGQAIGRLGCFAGGCCHGRVCHVPVGDSITGGLFPGGQVVGTEGFPFMAMIMERGVGVGNISGVPIYPTQLWEASGTFLLFVILSLIFKHFRKFDGQIMALYLMAYAGLRYFIETFRGDTIRGTEYFDMFSTSQLGSIGMATAGLLLALYGLKRGLAPETPYTAENDPTTDALGL